ncbi:MAG: response regulator [Candidatus Cloacimonetes bacterium]|nr:response regulator [Candidatus Cloacimonadota bacterium]
METTDKKIKLLVIDDDYLVFEIIRRMLKDSANVDYARSGDEAISHLSKTEYSLIFLDINLKSQESGLDVLNRIREIPKFANCKISATTAYAMLGDKERFLAAGCDYYLSKPFTRDNLKSLLENALQIEIA